MAQLSYPYMTTGKTIALTVQTFVGKLMSLLFNMLSRLVIAFLPKSKRIFNSMAAVTVHSDFGAQENKVCHCFHCFPIYFHEVTGLDAMIFVFWMLSFKPTFSLSSFPGGSDGKASAYNAGDPGSIPGSGKSPGEGNGNPLQYSCFRPPSTQKRGSKK